MIVKGNIHPFRPVWIHVEILLRLGRVARTTHALKMTKVASRLNKTVLNHAVAPCMFAIGIWEHVRNQTTGFPTKLYAIPFARNRMSNSAILLIHTFIQIKGATPYYTCSGTTQ
eukprot:m.335834 g.335834  ORF g.335834 m.335834 type:complete len:114 (+) comp17688_c0_seq1:1092-1433(+)